MPRIIFVVAHDRRGVIGKNGAMPWHLPADLQHFRELTLGKPVVMGRVTYEALGKPLPQRRNIVLTHDRHFRAEGIDVAHSPREALTLCADAPEVAVIGGAQVFAAFSDLVDAAFVTCIDADVEGDAFYEAPDRAYACEVLGTHAADERNAYAMTFMRFSYA